MLEIIIFYCLIFIIGTFLGSFLNVIIDRSPFDKSILFPASHCPHCKHRLGLIDLIPIFSFLFLQKRCRYCKARISWYYPLIETTTGFLFVLTAYIVIGLSVSVFLQQLGQLWFIIYLLLIISLLIVVFFIDLKYGIIPFKIVVLGLGIVTVRYIFLEFTTPGIFLNFLVTAILVFLTFLLLFLVTRGRAIGFGDVVFSLLMGYVLGFPKIVLAVYIAFLTGAGISLILVLANKKKLKGGTIPFGPFLVFATIVSLFWGQTIISELLLYLHVY